MEYIGKRSLKQLGMTEKQIVADYRKELKAEAAEQLRAFESERRENAETNSSSPRGVED